MKDGVELLTPNLRSQAGRWVSAIIVAVPWRWPSTAWSTRTTRNVVSPVAVLPVPLRAGRVATIILDGSAMVIGTVLAIAMATGVSVGQPGVALRQWPTLVLPYAYLHAPIFWSLLPTLYPSLSSGVPFLSNVRWEVS